MKTSQNRKKELGICRSRIIICLDELVLSTRAWKPCASCRPMVNGDPRIEDPAFVEAQNCRSGASDQLFRTEKCVRDCELKCYVKASRRVSWRVCSINLTNLTVLGKRRSWSEKLQVKKNMQAMGEILSRPPRLFVKNSRFRTDVSNIDRFSRSYVYHARLDRYYPHFIRFSKDQLEQND